VEDLHAKIWLHFNYDKEIEDQRQKNPYYFGEKNVGLVYVGLDYREIKKGGASRVLNEGEEPLSSKNLQADRCLFYVKKVGDEDIGVEKNKGVKKEDF
jgi:hypothetical protein